MNTSRLTVAISLLLALVLTACGSPSAGDPYADPGTEPPPPIEDPTVATSGSLSSRSDSDLMDINVAGFLAPDEGEGALRTAQVPDLTEGDFTVVEAGVVKGITVEKIAAGSDAPADIVFVFDTTGSMGGALATVQSSIIEFVDHLDGAGLDVRVGAVTYGDAFDTMSDTSTRTGTGSSTPPSFDTSERPVYPLTEDLDDFQAFIDEDSARGGGDAAENGVGALAYAYDEFEWGPRAQRIMIVITDIHSHNDETFGFTDGDDWAPEDPDELLERLRGNATVHVVGPDFGETGAGANTDMAMFAGVDGTGGEFVPFGDIVAEDASLTDLDITAATAGGYIVTFRGTSDGTPKDVRVVLDDGSDIRGEFTLRDRTY